MKPVIRSVGKWGHPNLRTWEPDDPDIVAEEIWVEIGPTSKAADTFWNRVATPLGLQELESRDGILAIRPLVVLRRYDYDDLWRWLRQTVESWEGLQG